MPFLVLTKPDVKNLTYSAPKDSLECLRVFIEVHPSRSVETPHLVKVLGRFYCKRQCCVGRPV